MNARSSAVPLLGGVALVYALILASAAVPAWQSVLWGVHAWTFLSPAALVAILAAAAAITALVLAAPPFPGSILKALPASLVAAPFFFTFHDTTHLLGDGRLWISVLAGQRAHHAHEPVAFAAALVVTVGKFVTAMIVEPRLEKYSAVLGVIAVFLTIRTAQRLAPDNRGRWLALGLLLGMGILQFGFGYIESYPLFWVAVLLYVHLCVETLLGKLPFAWAAASLGFAVAVHGSGLLLGPSFFVMLFLVRPKFSVIALSIVAGVLPVVLAYFGLPHILPAASANAPAGFRASAWNRIFSEFHLYAYGVGPWFLGQVNRWSLVSGGAIGLVLTGLLIRDRGGKAEPASGGVSNRDRTRAAEIMLAVAAVSMMLPAICLDMEGSRGAAADWDAFSVAAVPLMSLAILLWIPAAGRSKGARSLLAVIAGLGLITTLAFVGVNASEPLALKRFAGLAENVFRTPRAKSWAWESLAVYTRDERPEEAALYYQKAVQYQTTNPRLIHNAASMLVQTARYREAAEMYLRLSKLEANDPKIWFSLGAMLEQSDRPDSAMVAYRESLRIEPNGWEPMNYLARLVLKKPAGLVEGRALIERSLEVNPNQPTAQWGKEMLERLDEYEAKNPK